MPKRSSLLNAIIFILITRSFAEKPIKPSSDGNSTTNSPSKETKTSTSTTTSIFPKFPDLFTMSPLFTLPPALPAALNPDSKSTIFPTLPPLSPFTIMLPPKGWPSLEPLNFTPPTLPNLFDGKTVTLPPMKMPKMEPVNLNITINPEALMDVPEIVRHWGYPIETFETLTDDGYILTLHRIPHGRSENRDKTTKKPVVFLQHGLLCTSSIWLLNLPHQSAGFIFADRGYDVWLGNMRGNTYSKRHLKISSRNSNYWRFSWDEMAEYDIKAMINFVLKQTKQEHLYYVGHSQGVLTMLAKLSRDQTFGNKIRKFFAMAPVTRMENVKGLFYYLGEIYEQFSFFYNLFGDGEFLSNNMFTKLLTDIICDEEKGNPLCENFIFSVSGPNSNQFNTSRIGIYLAHNPAGTSSRNMLHFAQMVRTHRMAQFISQAHYKIRDYDLSKVDVPMTIFYSNNDWLASAADVEKYLLPSLPESSIKEIVKLKDFNHNDFLWGLRAKAEIYDKIIDTIELDFKRLEVQKQLLEYFQKNSSKLPERLKPMIIKQLSSPIDFD